MDGWMDVTVLTVHFIIIIKLRHSCPLSNFTTEWRQTLVNCAEQTAPEGAKSALWGYFRISDDDKRRSECKLHSAKGKRPTPAFSLPTPGNKPKSGAPSLDFPQFHPLYCLSLGPRMDVPLSWLQPTRKTESWQEVLSFSSCINAIY